MIAENSSIHYPVSKELLEIAHKIFDDVPQSEEGDNYLGYIIWNFTGYPLWYSGDPIAYFSDQLAKYKVGCRVYNIVDVQD